MALEYDHDEIVKDVALRLESDERYGLVKFFIFSNDTKTDLIGPYYPDITALRRKGRTKIMIEVQTPYSFEDSDEVRRLESLSAYCKSNNWEFYLVCPDQKTLDLTHEKIQGRSVSPREVWLQQDVPFAPFTAKEAQA
ncbi:MAG: hypothetical protein R3A11_04410 [Bdellovibrionota bacterium]